MILQNYYAYLYGKMMVPSNPATCPVKIRSLTGSETYTVFNTATFGLYTYANSNCRLLALVGDSDTVPTYEDYNMNSDRTPDFDNFSLTYSNTISTYNGDMCAEQIGVITGTNNTANAITLKEYGVYIISGNVTGNSNQGILMFHELLENPITVEPGETFQIPYSMRLF